MRYLIIAALALSTSSVSAQTTNCETFGNRTSCQTTAAPAYTPPPPIQQFNVAPLLEMHNSMRRQQMDEERTLRRRDLNERVSKMTPDAQYAIALMNAGRCDDLHDLTLQKLGAEKAIRSEEHT